MKVSACIITYNHQDYIVDCLEGALSQKVDFDYEIVIGEDNSTDATLKICEEYAFKYPDRIRLIKRDRNLGMIENWDDTIKSCKGKYIALCEGDDYWTDPLKLQKQVNFLENNPDFGLVHADCDMKDLNTKNIVTSINKKSNFKPFYNDDKNILFNAIIDGTYILRTATVVIRKSSFLEIFYKKAQIKNKFLMGDTPLWLYLSMVTKFHYFDEVFSMYNLSMNSITRPGDKLKELRFNLSMAEVRVWFVNEFNLAITEKLRTRYNRSLMNYKLFNINYEEMFPLIAPSSLELFLWNSLKHEWPRRSLRTMVSSNFFKIVYRKMQVVLK